MMPRRGTPLHAPPPPPRAPGVHGEQTIWLRFRFPRVVYVLLLYESVASPADRPGLRERMCWELASLFLWLELGLESRGRPGLVEV